MGMVNFDWDWPRWETNYYCYLHITTNFQLPRLLISTLLHGHCLQENTLIYNQLCDHLCIIRQVTMTRRIAKWFDDNICCIFRWFQWSSCPAYREYGYAFILKMYRFSFFVVDTEDSDVYSPLHGEDRTRKLRFEDSSRSNDGGWERRNSFVKRVQYIWTLERLDIKNRNAGRNAEHMLRVAGI